MQQSGPGQRGLSRAAGFGLIEEEKDGRLTAPRNDTACGRYKHSPGSYQRAANSARDVAVGVASTAALVGQGHPRWACDEAAGAVLGEQPQGERTGMLGGVFEDV